MCEIISIDANEVFRVLENFYIKYQEQNQKNYIHFNYDRKEYHSTLITHLDRGNTQHYYNLHVTDGPGVSNVYYTIWGLCRKNNDLILYGDIFHKGKNKHFIHAMLDEFEDQYKRIEGIRLSLRIKQRPKFIEDIIAGVKKIKPEEKHMQLSKRQFYIGKKTHNVRYDISTKKAIMPQVFELLTPPPHRAPPKHAAAAEEEPYEEFAPYEYEEGELDDDDEEYDEEEDRNPQLVAPTIPTPTYTVTIPNYNLPEYMDWEDYGGDDDYLGKRRSKRKVQCKSKVRCKVKCKSKARCKVKCKSKVRCKRHSNKGKARKSHRKKARK